MTDLYVLLEVERTASADEIKKSYRRIARDCHPDANPDNPEAEARFKEISAAYEVLSDPAKRDRYDRYGSVNGFDMSDPFGSGAGGLGDLFDSFFGSGNPFGGGGGRQRGPTGPPRGEDLETSSVIEFTDAVFGCQCEVEVRTAVRCDDCEATGARKGSSAETCPQCSGTGHVRTVAQSVLGQIVRSGTCNACGGQGQIIPDPCHTCSGAGRIIEEKTYTVDVPAGVDDGSTLKLSGRGAVGGRGGPAGDLYVRLRVKSHDVFERRNNDLVRELRIALTQAVLGAKVELETLDGTEDLKIPRGTEHGKLFRIKGKGVPHLDGRGRGDLLVVVGIDIPSKLEFEEEDLLRRFAAVRGDDVTPVDEGFFSKVKTAFKS
ncbi:MAG: molecular chaperone DnaJ [Microthrixaceae bacterium]